MDPVPSPAHVSIWGLVGFGMLTVGSAAMGPGGRPLLGGLLVVAGVLVGVASFLRGAFLAEY